MAIFFWERKGQFLINFFPQGDIIHAAAYCETLKKLHQAIQNMLRGMLM
jgi:hypothetical protein